MKRYSFIIAVLTIAILSSCRQDDLELEEKSTETEVIETIDWGEATHSNLAEPDYDMVFVQNEVLRFDIKIESNDWATMLADLDANIGSGSTGPGNRQGQVAGGMSEFDPVWVPCSFYFNGKEWYKVGVRFKGNSSLQSTYRMGINKYSFKLDFDQYEDEYPDIENQRFYGFKQLNLKNNFEDVSHMREKVASDIFREFGLGSPQTAFCVVYVDFGSGPQYFGVYTLVEEVDDTVLESQFADDSGNLYKPDGTAASFASGTYNDAEMEKKNNEDVADYTDVYGLYVALNSTDRTSNTIQWKSDLEQVLDVNAFLKWLAANTTMQNWDTYGKMTHNYYLYNNPATNLLTWIPWDNNEALGEGKQGGTLSFSMDEIDDSWPLIRYLMDDSEYKTIYENYLDEFVNGVFASSKLTETYDTYYNLIKSYAYDEVSGYTFLSYSGEFDAEVDALKSHVQDRNNLVIDYLK